MRNPARHADLNEAELTDLRQLLLQQRARLNAVLRGRATLNEYLPGLLDTPPTNGRELRQLHALDDALQKIDRPPADPLRAYGHCEHCGATIGYPRLLMHPAARHCLKCQRQAEKPDSSIS